MKTAALIPPGSVSSVKGPSRNARRKSINKKKKQTPGQPAKAAVSLKPPKTKPGRKNNKNGKQAKHIPGQSQPTKPAIPTTGSSARPQLPYKFNVMRRMVWIRPKPDEKFWIRGKIEKCEQSCVHEVVQNGNISISETVFHVVKCADDGTLYRVQLQHMERAENLIWL